MGELKNYGENENQTLSKRETRYDVRTQTGTEDMGEILALRGQRLQKMVGALTLMNVACD